MEGVGGEQRSRRIDSAPFGARASGCGWMSDRRDRRRSWDSRVRWIGSARCRAYCVGCIAKPDRKRLDRETGGARYSHRCRGHQCRGNRELSCAAFRHGERVNRGTSIESRRITGPRRARMLAGFRGSRSSGSAAPAGARDSGSRRSRRSRVRTSESGGESRRVDVFCESYGELRGARRRATVASDCEACARSSSDSSDDASMLPSRSAIGANVAGASGCTVGICSWWR